MRGRRYELSTDEPIVFVTGATGFIGRPTVAALKQAGFKVSVLLRTSHKLPLIADHVDHVIEGDLNNIEAIQTGADEADCVLHLACSLHRPWDTDLNAANVAGARGVAQACKDSALQPHLIMVSSLSARGPLRDDPTDQPVSAYGRAKLAAENEVLSIYERSKVSIVRPPMVIGPKDPATRSVFQAIHRGVIPTSSSPNARFSLIDVRDLADGLAKLAVHGAIPNQALYFSFEDTLRFEELAERIYRNRPRNFRTIRVPNSILWVAAAGAELSARLLNRDSALNLDKYREMTNGPWTCVSSKVQVSLRWQPANDLDTRLAQVFDSYKFDGDHETD